MSYTYPEALAALESIANDYIKIMRPNNGETVVLVCDANAQTASVTWSPYGIRVTMPVRPATSIMTQAEFEDWIAYMLHELGHPTHTDKAAWVGAVRDGVSRMVNALEDVRMEKAVIASGIVPNAKAVLSRLVSRKVAEAMATWKPNSRREFGWTICVLGRVANGYAIPASDVAWINAQIKPGSTVKAVLGWAMPALAACRSTDDCVELAKRINAALAGPQQGADTRQQLGQPGQGEGEEGEGEGEEGKGAGEEGEGEGEGEGQGAGEGAGEGEGEEGEEGEGEGANAPSDAADAPAPPLGSDKGPSEDVRGKGAGGKGGKGHGDGTTDEDETPVSDHEQVERELAPEGDAMQRSEGAHTEASVLSILRDSVMKAEPRHRDARTRLGVTGTKMKEAAAKASKQRAMLARALRANETEDREGGRKAGRLDRGALTRAMAGATNVFARREISDGFDTDVCVLLDASGSMSGSSMFSALEAGLIISQAAGSVGASCTTEIFNQHGYWRAGPLASKRQPNPCDFAGLHTEANGGTPLSSHMARMAVAQARRAPQKRRVLFIVTDGGCDYGPQTLARMATYLEQAYGTVLAHVSIGTPLRGSFKAEVRVDHGQPIAEVGLDHFVKVLQAL